MSVQTKLQDLTVDEKIMAMELLWKDLSVNSNNISSPDWHGQILQNRAGKEDFIDWSVAKQKI